MILYIAEKPSLGRALADALPRPHRRQEGCIYVGNGDCVSWCIGHLLEQAEPDSYDPTFKQWKLEHLPIIPDQWQLKPRSSSRKQLNILKKLVKQAEQLVHVGDPDREGQLLVDELINFVKATDKTGVKKGKYQQVQRCLVNDLNPSAVKRALSQLRENRDFIPLSTSALARSRADWLYGINLTRAYTVQGRKVGYQGVLSVGRVQTPVLGLVVRRDKVIENFVSKPFYEVLAHLMTADGEPFTAKWQPSESCQPQMDEEGRVLSRKLAELVAKRITDKPAEITKSDTKKRRQAPPLPFNLSTLQIEASKRYGMTAQQVLDNCQSLYERHKLITYPRSDSRYLPLEHHQQASAVIQQIARNCSTFSQIIQSANPGIKSKAWNDSKVDAHHAIIPTLAAKQLSALSKSEQHLYELISRQYLCQFFPDHRFLETRVELVIEGGLFTCKGNQITDQGWKMLFPKKPEQFKHQNSEPNQDKNSKLNSTPEQQTDAPSTLPVLEQGQQLHCHRGELLEKQTQPPKAFTDATLLAAMTGISRYVEDAEIRKILKETDGLGTEATRAGIIELLFKRGFLVRQGKQIHSTPAGKGLISSLSESSTKPDMTAQWESVLNAISLRERNYQSFMEPMITTLTQLVAEASQTLPTGLQGVATAPTRKKRKWGKTKPKTRK
ncbi:DNA topoisomerase III [Motiliproteus sp. MSK22-1]|uniref:DNA topoisomerase III n=1 Tax=Motiliproteus sp. MSK22-1 TaxID=1897630 RepID=UPI00097734F7|nr:DNA topoisomerase III [Motiliproteus sp. MSK22-1]OMH38836.1 DNA topoisomerase III [Motiliproteus sp. MSK22-1]